MGNTQSKLSEIQEENMMNLIPIPKTVRNYPDGEKLTGEWKKYVMVKSSGSVGIGGIYDFEVYVLTDGNNVYMKPVRMVMTSEFESLFGFGMGCDGYDKDRVIKVLNPEDYKKNLIEETNIFNNINNMKSGKIILPKLKN